MSHFERNLAALEARWPALAASLAPPEALEPVPTASGELTARLPGSDGKSGAWLASRIDPRAEARRAAAACLSSRKDAVVLLGLGLGYLAEALLAADGELKVIACEADSALFAACLGVRDLSALLADGRLSLVVGGDPGAIGWALESLGAREAALASTPALAERSAGWYAALREALERWLDKERVNERTLRRFGRLWVRNLSRNAAEPGRRRGIAGLAGAFAGFPALVLAAGPTLDEALPFLAELRRRALLIAVDTALPSLAAAGIESDFVVVADPQYWNARHLDRARVTSSIIVTEAAVHPATFRLDARAFALASSLYPLGRFLEDASGDAKGRLGAGGSVATGAWDFARILGCAPVFFAGLDLAFPGMRTHARASRFEQRALDSGRRLAPAALALFRAAVSGQPFAARSAEGGEVASGRALALYAAWFESRLARHPETPTSRLSGAGLAIAGMGTSAPGEVLRLPDLRGDLDARLESIAAEWSVPPPGGSEGVERARAELLELFARTRDAALAAASTAAAARRAVRTGRAADRALRELDRADRALLSSRAKDLVGFLYPTPEELGLSRSANLDESLEASERIYGSIAESAAWHLDLLEAGPAPA
ncbi:MAG: DUF115 domain-containing protein [Spirochaetia bacterium]|nr:DUF115 domain-containing protein [Spirochaetia bacterium]